MTESVSHDRSQKSLEAKARWFQSLSLEARMDVFVAFTNLILENNPDIVKGKPLPPASDRVQIISLSDIQATRED
jgi:uncharacterized ferritin-like protein (DUF455 family)